MDMKFVKHGICIFCEQDCKGHNYWHEECKLKFVEDSN